MNRSIVRDSEVPDAEMWTILLSSPSCTDAERDAFESWLANAPENPTAYARAQRTHTLTRELAGDELLMADLRRARRASSLDPYRTKRWASVGLAAVLVIALALPAWNLLTDIGNVEMQHYAAGIGEQRSILLADGSRMMLDTASEALARFDGKQRRVELKKGQAEFAVSDGDDRPFVVVSGGSEIRDIGTTFQVRNVDDKLSVTLIDGLVEVRSARPDRTSAKVKLLPGQKLTVGPDGVQIVGAVDIDEAGSWTQGSLLIHEQRLDQLLLEMNRYSSLQVRLADPADGAILISGKYRVGDQQALLKTLQAGWSLRPVSASPNEVVLKQ